MAKRQQLTLLDLQRNGPSKKRRVEDAGPSSTSMDDFVCISDDSGPDLDTESDDGECTSGQVSTRSGNQQYITVNKPTGATTIVMTSFASLDSDNTTASTSIARNPNPLEIQPPSDIASGLQQSPVQPIVSFPVRAFGNGKSRAFNSEWYSSYSWLEYSVERDAAFCYPCRLFHITGTRAKKKTFTKVGFRDWKHAKGKKGIFSAHDICSTHKQAMCSWSSYTENFEKHSSIVHRLESAREHTIKSNRHYIASIAEVILLCCKQELALRGHIESSKSNNKGNFIEILHVVASHDPSLRERMLSNPQNATYLSPDIQNQLLEVMGSIAREEVCKAVRNAGYFTLLGDETKDVSKVEQLAIVVRYVDMKTASVYERFLTYVSLESLTADSLTNHLLSTLSLYHLDIKHLVSQGYDGASVMSGCCSGVQTQIRKKAPQAVYIHCNAHCLNLCLVDSVKAIPESAEFFALVEALYVFLSTSKCHVLFMAKQKQLKPGKQQLQLQKLSDTRWACRHGAVNAICCTYDAVVATLSAVADEHDGKRSVEARGLLCQVNSFSFLVCLVTFDRILSVTKSLSDALQSTQLDLAKAAELVLATTDTLQDFRSDHEWQKLLSYCKDVSEMHNICPSSSSRERRCPRRIEESFVYESTGARDSSPDYKLSLYFPVIHAILAELCQRFTDKNRAIMQALQACSPTCSGFLELKHLQPLVSMYNLDKHALEIEVPLAKRSLAGKAIEDISDVILELMPLQAAFPALLELLQISMTIAVSTAKCERCFSALKRVKSYLRNSMSDQRLANLAILSIEHDISEKMDFDTIVNHFSHKNRRIDL